MDHTGLEPAILKGLPEFRSPEIKAIPIDQMDGLTLCVGFRSNILPLMTQKNVQWR